MDTGNQQLGLSSSLDEEDHVFDGRGNSYDISIAKDLNANNEAKRIAPRLKKERAIDENISKKRSDKGDWQASFKNADSDDSQLIHLLTTLLKNAEEGEVTTEASFKNDDSDSDDSQLTHLLTTLLKNAEEGEVKMEASTTEKPSSCLRNSPVKSTITNNDADTTRRRGIYWNEKIRTFSANSENTHVEEEIHLEESIVIGALDSNSPKENADGQGCIYDDSGDLDYFDDDAVDRKVKNFFGRVMVKGESRKDYVLDVDIEDGDSDQAPSKKSGDKTKEQNENKRGIFKTNRDKVRPGPLNQSGGKGSPRSNRQRLDDTSNHAKALGSSMMMFNTIAKSKGRRLSLDDSDSSLLSRQGSSSEKRDHAASTICSILYAGGGVK